MRVIIILLSILLLSSKSYARWNGKTYCFAETSVLKEVDYSGSYVIMLNTGVEYIGNPLKSFGCELNLWHYTEQGNQSTGIGIRPLTKYYLLKTNIFRIIIEVKGGVMYMMPEYPEGGSKFNFTFAGSVGGDLRITDKSKLLLAARYSHMSNWNIYGEDNNPTWDGIGIVVGMIWQLYK